VSTLFFCFCFHYCSSVRDGRTVANPWQVIPQKNQRRQQGIQNFDFVKAAIVYAFKLDRVSGCVRIMLAQTNINYYHVLISFLAKVLNSKKGVLGGREAYP
jgi:hypothetical protein